MKFSGRLQIEADPRNWLKTDLNLNHGRLELVSGDDILGSWSTAQVKAERVEGDRFQLHLGDDRAVFAADDALAFSYEALPVLAKKTVLATATNLRGKLRKGLAAADRTALAEEPDPYDPPPIPAPDVQSEQVASDPGEVPQPTRKLRDLIQAAVRSNMGEPPPASNSWPPPEDSLRGPESTRRGSESSGSVAVADLSPPTGASAPFPLKPDEASQDVESEADAVVEQVREAASIPDLPPPAGKEVQHARPPFDFSPSFAESVAANDPNERARPSRPILDLEATGFENGDTLGERPAEPFGWVRASVEATPAVLTEPPPPLVRSLDTLIEEVRSGAMSPAQVGAVTELIRAVAETIEDRNRR